MEIIRVITLRIMLACTITVAYIGAALVEVLRTLIGDYDERFKIRLQNRGEFH